MNLNPDKFYITTFEADYLVNGMDIPNPVVAYAGKKYGYLGFLTPVEFIKSEDTKEQLSTGRGVPMTEAAIAAYGIDYLEDWEEF